MSEKDKKKHKGYMTESREKTIKQCVKEIKRTQCSKADAVTDFIEDELRHFFLC